MEELNETDGRLIAQRIGVNSASTFTGFCHGHDSSTFAAIDQPITTLSEEQVFLLAYRTLCRELYTKTAELEVNKLGKQFEIGQNKRGGSGQGTSIAIERWDYRQDTRP